MLYIAYYIVYPSHRLIGRLEREPLDAKSFLSQPRVWIKEQDGRTPWVTDDYEEQAKLLFLAHLLTAAEDPPTRHLLDELIGSPPYTGARFDQWWELLWFLKTRDDLFEEVENDTDVHALQLLGPPESTLVSEWLEALIQRKHVSG